MENESDIVEMRILELNDRLRDAERVIAIIGKFANELHALNKAFMDKRGE